MCYIFYFLLLHILVSFYPNDVGTNSISSYEDLKEYFQNPPDSSRPGVYWYFMDGNISKEAMTKDLEAMKEAGIGAVIFLEVNVGIPRGKVEFLSNQWQDLFKHAVKESERLGIEFTLGIGPGWTGSGGPWVEASQSMQHLVASSIGVTGPLKIDTILPVPKPKPPYFGENVFTDSLKKEWQTFYKDEVVLAFPSSDYNINVNSVDEKALYYRAPFSSVKGVKPYFSDSTNYPKQIIDGAIIPDMVTDISRFMAPDGSLRWKVPEGTWTIMRFGRRNNGAVTRPAPFPGLGFECDKFDTTALNTHFDAYIGKLINIVGKPNSNSSGGWKMLHMDSWEMGAQNWTEDFREEFVKRRGYDPIFYLPVFTGKVVESLEQSERFLWDLRLTSQELVIENHAKHVKELGRRFGFGLSIEPYDMNPCADLTLGAVADIPMCEFWSKGFGYNTSYSCIEAASVAHVLGKPVVAAEAFTSLQNEAWKLYPGAVKNQGDWAFCAGINRLYYHTFIHNPFNYKPGMTMGPYGVHWDRGQTWWPMAKEYHNYISRCQFMLQQGTPVADILYLTPEGAPHVFQPPPSALSGNDTIPDRRGYNFDGCSPDMLISGASVKNGRIVSPGGATYRLLVLPDFKTMTPELLMKIESLVEDGANVIGSPPLKSPSLVNYPECDSLVRQLAKKIWGGLETPAKSTVCKYGKGRIFWGGSYTNQIDGGLYPHYNVTSKLLDNLGNVEDFKSNGSIRYTHRIDDNKDIYFVSNRTNQKVVTNCFFRVEGIPELWDPIAGERRGLPKFKREGNYTVVPLQFEVYQSFFIVFNRDKKDISENKHTSNFPETDKIATLEDSWTVSFDPEWGGPEKVKFNELENWTDRSEDGIKYYSGIATYTKEFDLPNDVELDDENRIYIDLGKVNNIARVRLNGENIGVVWTAPWCLEITRTVKTENNILEIEVANLWPNRLIGDERFKDDGIKDGQWPEWLVDKAPRKSERYTFTTNRYHKKDFPLLNSGLLGPVTITQMVND